MKIKCFSKRKLNVRKIQIFTNLQPFTSNFIFFLQPFSFNLQQDLKIAAFWENPEKIDQTFRKNSADLWQNL